MATTCRQFRFPPKDHLQETILPTPQAPTTRAIFRGKAIQDPQRRRRSGPWNTIGIKDNKGHWIRKKSDIAPFCYLVFHLKTKLRILEGGMPEALLQKTIVIFSGCGLNNSDFMSPILYSLYQKNYYSVSRINSLLRPLPPPTSCASCASRSSFSTFASASLVTD